ncbi:MAG: hypothetical protein KDA81_22780, partial [Planctomycetaceae bacterium]|nr:hypothetical protein [Planctomycetaceae bacterium]
NNQCLRFDRYQTNNQKGLSKRYPASDEVVVLFLCAEMLKTLFREFSEAKRGGRPEFGKVPDSSVTTEQVNLCEFNPNS